MKPRASNADQIQIAARVRLARRARGMSQGELGQRLDVTFQQIQKYENGYNRFSAGTLARIARALDMPVSYFFEDVADLPGALADNAIKQTIARFLADPDSFRMAQAFVRMPERCRRATCDIVENIANLQPA